MNSYWYFTYLVDVKSTGEHSKDDGIVSSTSCFFPIADITKMYKEDLPDDAKVTILNTVEISADDYLRLYAKQEADYHL